MKQGLSVMAYLPGNAGEPPGPACGAEVGAITVIEGRHFGEMRRTDAQSWLESEAPLSPMGREFLLYWHSKCPAPPGSGFPTRADIAPEEIPRLLPHIFMVDVLEREGEDLDFRFRLVGTAIANIEGEHTDRQLSDMFPDRAAYEVLWRQYRDAVAGKIWVRRETLRWRDRDHVEYEVILAPLQDDAGRVSMLIGLAHGSDN